MSSLTPRWWSLGLGSLALVGLGILSLSAFGSASSALFALGALIALIVVMAFVFRAPRSASWCDLEVPRRVERGSDAAVVLALEVEGSSRWVAARALNSTATKWVAGTSALRWPIDTSRRGVFRAGPDALVFADPFGMRTRQLAVREPSTVTVVPRVGPVTVMPARTSDNLGERSEVVGSGQFHSVREYVVGDPLKLIHWKASARTGTLITRRLVDESAPSLLLILDTRRDSFTSTASAFADFSPEQFERAVDLAASYAWHYAGAGLVVRMTTLTSDAPLMTITLRTRESCLDWLATVTSDGAGARRLGPLLRNHAGSSNVLVTGQHAPDPRTSGQQSLTIARAS